MNRNNSDDYHFLNDIESGFTTSNPMNKNTNVSLNQYDNSITNTDSNYNSIHIFERIYKPCIILVSIFITTGLGFIIYLFFSKL